MTDSLTTKFSDNAVNKNTMPNISNIQKFAVANIFDFWQLQLQIL